MTQIDHTTSLELRENARPATRNSTVYLFHVKTTAPVTSSQINILKEMKQFLIENTYDYDKMKETLIAFY